MKTLWFKSEFVAAILSGEKRDTIRNESIRLPRVGETVAFTVGPRPAFAQATIDTIEPVESSELPPDHRAAVSRCIGESSRPLVRITFSLSR